MLVAKATLVLTAALAIAATLPAQRQTCTTSHFGNNCGPVLTVSAEPHSNSYKITFAVSNAKPQTTVLMSIGLEPVDLLITGTSCFLYTVPVFTQVHQTNHSGFYDFSKAIPPISPGTTYIQFIELSFDNQNQLVIRSTQGGKMVCTVP
jgi:hypothetical protein